MLLPKKSKPKNSLVELYFPADDNGTVKRFSFNLLKNREGGLKQVGWPGLVGLKCRFCR